MKVRIAVREAKAPFIDLVLRPGSFWIGAHYSKTQRAICIALIPCVVIRVGRTKYRPKK